MTEIITPAKFRKARLAMGLSAAKLAKLLYVADGRSVRRWEAGDRAISAQTDKLMRDLINRRS